MPERIARLREQIESVRDIVRVAESRAERIAREIAGVRESFDPGYLEAEWDALVAAIADFTLSAEALFRPDPPETS